MLSAHFPLTVFKPARAALSSGLARLLRRGGLTALAMAALSAPAASQAARHADECRISSDHRMFEQAEWFGVYWDQKKVGYFKSYALNKPPGGLQHRDGQHLELAYTISITIGGDETLVRESRYYDARPPHKLIAGTLSNNDKTINYSRVATGLKLVSGDQTLHWSISPWTLCDEEIVATADQLGQANKVGDTFSTQVFDLETMAVHHYQHEVESVSRKTLNGIEHVFQTVLSTTDEIASMGKTRLRQRFRDGLALTIDLGQLEARQQSREEALSPVQDIAQIDLLTIPVVDTIDPRQLSAIQSMQLRVSVNDPLAKISDVIGSGLMQTVRYLDDTSAEVLVMNANQQAVPVKDISRYLAANFTYPADHPRIRQIISNITTQISQEQPGTPVSDTALAHAILHHTARSIQYELVGTRSVLEVLKTRRGDCTEYAAMFITLARAAGLPAREATGFIYTGNKRRGEFGGHAWVEVLIDGQWVSMDPTADQTLADNTHIQFRNFMARGLTLSIQSVQYAPAANPDK